MSGLPDLAALLPDVALKLLGDPPSKTAHEWRWGRRGSLSIDVEKGVWRDHEAGIGGGTLALIEHKLGLRAAQAFSWLRDERLISKLAPKPRGTKGRPAERAVHGRADDTPRETRHACEVWRKSVPLWDPWAAPAVAYLTARGLPRPYPETLAFAELLHPHTGQALATLIVARHCPAAGLVRGVQRIFLDPAGGKYRGGTAKMSLGRIEGGRAELLRQFRPERLLVAEGVETTLSGARLFGYQAAWAMCGGFPRKIALPPSVLHVLVVADNDAAGTSEKRARALAQWIISTGRRCAIQVPRLVGADANDVVMAAEAR